MALLANLFAKRPTAPDRIPTDTVVPLGKYEDQPSLREFVIDCSMRFDDALDALRSEDNNGVDLIFIVHRPYNTSAEVRAALEQPERYRILEILDQRLKVKLPWGEDVYQFLNIPLLKPETGGLESVRTVCTHGMLVAEMGKISTEVQEQLETILDEHGRKIFPEESIRH